MYTAAIAAPPCCMGAVAKIRKRKYSRNGCVECKRRRQKCDEGKPGCLQCVRLHKACVYELRDPIRFAQVEYTPKQTRWAEARGRERKPSRGSETKRERLGIAESDANYETPKRTVEPGFKNRPFMSQPNLDNLNTDGGHVSPTDHTTRHSTNKTHHNYILPHTHTTDAQNTYDTHPPNPTSHAVHHPASSTAGAISPGYIPQDASFFGLPPMDEQAMKELLDGASMLVANINDLGVEWPFDDGKLRTGSVLTPGGVFASTEIQKGNRQLAQEVIEIYELERVDSELLLAVCAGPQSFLLFPLALSVEHNPVVAILLKHLKSCRSLMHSLVALAATFLNNTGHRGYELASRAHVHQCILLLSVAFTTPEDKEHHTWTEIEGLLLTVLVLTTIFASANVKPSNLDSWRAHLRGAKDLLLNCILSYNGPIMTSGLALAKTWYFAIEATAGISIPLGGTLGRRKSGHRCDDELLFMDTGFFDAHSNPDYCRMLVRLQLLTTTKHPFNLFLGCTIEYVRAAEELMRAFVHLRERPGSAIPSRQVTKILGLIHQSFEAVIVPGVDIHTFAIPEQLPDAPSTPQELPASVAVAANQSVSYFDLCQQVHTHNLYLKALITPGIIGVDKSHPRVREVVSLIINSLIFVRQHPSGHWHLDRTVFDHRAVMVQSTVFSCIQLVDNQQDLERVRLYFQGLSELGIGSAAGVLKQVRLHGDNLLRMRFAEIPYHEPGIDTLPFS